MRDAVETICQLGLDVIAAHRKASDQAERVCQQWQLVERQQAECEHLRVLFDAFRLILEKLNDLILQAEVGSMLAASETIEQQLPLIERCFLEARHCALDLLRWTKRAGEIEDSPLPDQYRKSYAALIAFTPTLKPALDSLQNRLANQLAASNPPTGTAELLSAITRLNGVLDTARRFVRAIVEPPLDLVFQETEHFISDRNKYSVDECMQLASEINDCCQFLLYDRDHFESKVEHVQANLPEGFETSLYCLRLGDERILFTVDEDPIFGQLTIDLLRIVHDTKFSDAANELIETLYQALK